MAVEMFPWPTLQKELLDAGIHFSCAVISAFVSLNKYKNYNSSSFLFQRIMHLAIISDCTARLYQTRSENRKRFEVHDFPTVRNTGLNAYRETPERLKHADK